MYWFVYLAESTGLSGEINMLILIRRKKIISYSIARHIVCVVGRITAHGKCACPNPQNL